MAAFFGSTFYIRLLNKFGDSSKRLPHNVRQIPNDPYSLFNQNLVHSQNREELERRLTDIAKSLYAENDAMEKIRANAIDCYLYARADKYAKKT